MLLFQTSTETNEIQNALSLFKKNMPLITKDYDVKMEGTTKAGKEYKVNYAYAPLEVLQEATKEPLTSQGLSVTQMLSTYILIDKLYTGILTRVNHKSGQYFQSFWAIDFTGIIKEQDRGSKITYNKRYAYAAALDLALCDEDDDAAALTKAQSTQMQKQTKVIQQEKSQTVSVPNLQGNSPRDKEKKLVTEAQLQRLWAIQKKSNKSPQDLVLEVKSKYGITEFDKLNMLQYDEVINWLQS